MHTRALRTWLVAVFATAATAAIALFSTVTTLIQLTATTALIMGGTGMKVLGADDQWGPGSYLDNVNETYLHLDESMLKWVSTPEQFWPATGLTDISFDTSVARGVQSLDDAVRTTSGTKVVVGYSQSAAIATLEKRHLDALRAAGATDIPGTDDLSFVLVANPNRPNGGILERFNGLSIPLLGVSFDGATPDDGYQTTDVARQYDAIADFPEYPLNVLADVNALLGYVYLHPNYGSGVVDLSDPTTYQAYTSGNTTYYLVYTQHLPLLQPLRDIGVPAAALDLVEPALRVMIELGYDRTPEKMGVATPAKLFRPIDPEKLAADLSAALHKGVHDALEDIGIKTEQKSSAPAQLDAAKPSSETATTTKDVKKPPHSALRQLESVTKKPARVVKPEAAADPSTTEAAPTERKRVQRSKNDDESSKESPAKDKDTQAKSSHQHRDTDKSAGTATKAGKHENHHD